MLFQYFEHICIKYLFTLFFSNDIANVCPLILLINSNNNNNNTNYSIKSTILNSSNVNNSLCILFLPVTDSIVINAFDSRANIS